jgi:hypothetical protein
MAQHAIEEDTTGLDRTLNGIPAMMRHQEAVEP